MSWLRFSIAHPWAFAAACLLVLAAATLAIRRRPAVNKLTAILCAIGLILLAFAAGGLAWRAASTSQLVVMIDLSPSTRGAGFRERAALDRRLRELLPAVPYNLVYFSDELTDRAPPGDVLGDLPARRTTFGPPPDAAAVILFSDAQFPIPTSRPIPPTYVVADPLLDKPADAAVARLEQRDHRVAATVRTATTRRVLRWEGVEGEPADAVEPADASATTLARPVAPAARTLSARLEPGDRWPENDGLFSPVLQPAATQKWLVTTARSAPQGWRAMTPANLPTDAAAYLAPSAIVLDNVSAEDLSDAQLGRLEQYVRDLGGGLLVGGGARAFAGGLYPGTALEALSPLASTPPQPTTHWILLADASGSMSQRPGPAGNSPTYWHSAAAALVGLIPSLPPQDPVSAGSFSSDVRWWSTGRPARETAALALPPADVAPSGPTNLAAALDRVAREAPAGLAGELLVISDADVTIDSPDRIVAALREKKIRLHILAVGEERARGYDALGRMAKDSGGTILRQADARRWAADVRRLLEAAWPDRWMEAPADAEFLGPLADLGNRRVPRWNRTWLKSDATPLARARVAGHAEPAPLAARWQAGQGRAAAVAFPLDPGDLPAFSGIVEKSPRDPRFAVTWETGGPDARVIVSATENRRPWNNLQFRLRTWAASEAIPDAAGHPLTQTAPGRYELRIETPTRGMLAAVERVEVGGTPPGSAVIDRAAIPARYAPEFEHIGNDYPAMRKLADHTGGEVIDSLRRGPLRIDWPRREIDLSAWLAGLGAAALAGAAARWRWG